MSSRDFDVPDTSAQRQPTSELDIYDRATRPTSDDPFLDNVNLGLGNYDSKEYWQQVAAFKQGLYADAAFSRRLLERAIEATKRDLARERWADLDAEGRAEAVADHLDEDVDEPSRRQFVEATKDDLWRNLGPDADDERYTDQELEQARLEARMREVESRTGISREWTPPQWRMVQMRHEASRSRRARLLDNLFGRVTEVRNDAGEAAEKLLGGSN